VTGEFRTCPDGWGPPAILDYLDDEMDPAARADFERHLSGCSVCSSELKTLQRVAGLIEAHPEALHPDEHELYEFVLRGRDPEGWISVHIRSCENCTEDAVLLRHMIAARSAVPEPRPVMSKALADRLERTLGHVPPRKPGEAFWSKVLQRLGIGFRAPMLAMGTAAALVVAVLLGIPLWKTYVEIPRPGLEFEDRRIDKTRRALPGAIEPRSAERDSEEAGLPRPPTVVREEEASPEKDLPLSLAPPRALPPLGEQASEPARDGASVPRRPAGKTKLKAQSRAPEEKRARAAQQTPVPQDVLESSRPQAPAKARKMEALPPSVSGEVPRSRPVVAVQIQGAAEAGVPGLKFVPPQALAHGFVFEEGQGKKSDASRPEPMPEQWRMPPAEESPRPGLLMVFHVAVAGDAFDLTANLFEDGSTLPKKTVRAAKVKKNNLEATLESLGTRLLADQ